MEKINEDLQKVSKDAEKIIKDVEDKAKEVGSKIDDEVEIAASKYDVPKWVVWAGGAVVVVTLLKLWFA